MISLIVNSVPNLSSEQANADPIIFAKYLKSKGIKVNIISLFNKNYFSSDKSLEKYKENIKENYKIDVIPIYYSKEKKLKKFINKFNNLFNYGQVLDENIDEIQKKISFNLTKFKSKAVINFFDIPILLAGKRITNKKIKIINYIGVYKTKLEILRREIYKKNIKLWWRIPLAYIYEKKSKLFYSNRFICSDLNLCPALDTYEELERKNNIKNLKLTKPLSQIREAKSNNSKIQKKIKIFMIGNLRSSFMEEALEDIYKNRLIYENLFNKYKFKIDVVGKFKPRNNFFKKKNNWIKFHGWKEKVDSFYKNCDILLVPNKYQLAPRTKILEAMSAGKCVVTYSSNIYSHKEFKNFKNIVYGNNTEEFFYNLEYVIKNHNERNKIGNNARKIYNQQYNPLKIMNYNYKLIKAIL
mgnify:CR=1 FL=1|tara:strand:- start:9859 stop:11094 length:1236 start_codon:yes stop_codon:yes gene_type:complete